MCDRAVCKATWRSWAVRKCEFSSWCTTGARGAPSGWACSEPGKHDVIIASDWSLDPIQSGSRGFDDQKLKKWQLKIFCYLFFDQKSKFTYPKASIKDVQAAGKACIPQKRTSSTSRNEIYLFILVLWAIFAPLPGSGSKDPIESVSGSTTLTERKACTQQGQGGAVRLDVFIAWQAWRNYSCWMIERTAGAQQ